MANVQKTKRGHLRSKSASLVKNTIVKQYRNHLRREKINSGKSSIDITANPQITLTKNITDSVRRKCHTLPKSLDASKLEDLSMKNELPNSIKLDSRTKKREKISNMLSSIAGEKKEIMRDAIDSLKSGKDRGMSKIRKDIITRPTEGMIDMTEPAFDVANIYEQADNDDAIVGSLGAIASVGAGGLGSVLEYRDLSAWRVSIPRLRTSSSSGKHCFVYEIDVQRIDIRAVSENAEDLHWKVQRQYSEFYALESKLIEFHGEVEDVKFPPRVKIFFHRGLDVMQSKIKLFEDYLAGLLQKPSLKGSDLLFTFLTSPEEFTVAASYLGMGKMIKNVPMKLTKEKGQSLQPFIDNFVASTLSQSSKPRYDKDMMNTADKDSTSERIIAKHKIYEDNFSVNEELKIGAAYKYFSHKKSVQEITSTYDTLVYLAANLFRVPIFTLQLMLGVGIIIKNTFDHIVEYGIASKLSQVLCCRRLAYLCRLTEEALFDSGQPGTMEDKRRRKTNAFRNFRTFIKPFTHYLTGEEKFLAGTKFIFEALQDPIINKQLAMQLFDQIIFDLFPELNEKT